ncbi:hypothetical protein ABT214_33620, partial [Micromonospora purpureochromogenes]|uniref:hypothetical protein n=1 Tax=Micromonospora purpureochromogenes TaxID=47872 RepID=UPI0033611679
MATGRPLAGSAAGRGSPPGRVPPTVGTTSGYDAAAGTSGYDAAAGTTGSVPDDGRGRSGSGRYGAAEGRAGCGT